MKTKKETSQGTSISKTEKIFYTAVAIYGVVFFGIQITRFIIQNL